MKRYHYVEESDDLKLARQKDADAYAEFLRWESRSLWALRGWSGQAQSFSHRYDAREEA